MIILEHSINNLYCNTKRCVPGTRCQFLSCDNDLFELRTISGDGLVISVEDHVARVLWTKKPSFTSYDVHIQNSMKQIQESEDTEILKILMDKTQ